MHYENIMFATIGFGFIVGIAVGASACNSYEPVSAHCAQSGGDSACMEKFGDARPFCVMCGAASTLNDGCAAEKPKDLGCYSPCGDLQSYEDDSSCIGAGDDGADGADEGSGADGGEPTACAESADCTDSAMPFCDLDSGECVGCDGVADSDAACAGLGEGNMPVCADGMCVECDGDKAAACMGVTPICDDVANLCMGCSEHEQCLDSACNLAVGNCIDPANIMHVNGSDADCAMGDGSKEKPFCDLEHVLSNSSGETVVFIHAMSGDNAYQEANTVDDTLVLFGVPNQDGHRPILQGSGNSPALQVGPSGSLSLRNVQISNSPVEGLRVMGAAWIEQSLVINNDHGGIVVDGGALTIENSFVGGDDNSQIAVNVMSGSATITYTTLAMGFAGAAALACGDGTTTVVRNSLLVARTTDPELECADAIVTDSALELDLAGNTSLGTMADTSWFLNYGEGDFHLSDNQPMAINTAARWMMGDPVTDIDGEPRPAVVGGSDFAGADLTY